MFRLPAAVAVAAALTLVLAGLAIGASTRTSQTPEQIRAYHDSGAYRTDIDEGFADATAALRGQLKRKPRKPAVVLDIDETTLSNYGCLDAHDFDLAQGLADCVVNSKSTAFAAAKRFIRVARQKHVRIVFITGAPEAVRTQRKANLAKVGIDGPYTLIMRPPSDKNDSLVPYKSGERRKLTRRGFTIVVNVGDQRSDLQGGYAKRMIKLPNPIYVTT